MCPTRARTVTVPLRDGRFRCNARFRAPNDACCCRADRPSAQREASGGPLATEAGDRFHVKGIRPLSPSDWDEVLRINSECQPGVAHLDRTELERLIGLKNEHLGMEGPDGRLVGYLLAFPSDTPYDGEEFFILTKTSIGPFIYVDQVAVDTAMRRKGAGSRLYQAIESAAQRRGVRTLSCEINLNPPNPGSLAFHRSRGFKQTSVMETQDGRTVTLMSKSLESPERQALSPTGRCT